MGGEPQWMPLPPGLFAPVPEKARGSGPFFL